MVWSELLALAAIVGWPLVPICWLQIHNWLNFWRKHGRLTYAPILLEWFVVAVLVLALRNYLLGMKLDLGALRWVGLMLALVGVYLQAWAIRILGWRTLLGYSELGLQAAPQKLVTHGPYSIVRHPTYLAHTLFVAGTFLLSEYTGVGVLALAEFLTSYFLITTLEEGELEERFGDEYRKYREHVLTIEVRIMLGVVNSWANVHASSTSPRTTMT